MSGVISVKADHKKQAVRLSFNGELTSESALRAKLASMGFKTG